ncbi:hypothetical protein [Neptuniibacter sp. QD37_11]|uniref:hypothetical protein n=1 Tax=Neptuniibacter sp. QD37_11 TaxID=3398209 RepID=UPI0039F53521
MTPLGLILGLSGMVICIISAILVKTKSVQKWSAGHWGILTLGWGLMIGGGIYDYMTVAPLIEQYGNDPVKLIDLLLHPEKQKAL